MVTQAADHGSLSSSTSWNGEGDEGSWQKVDPHERRFGGSHRVALALHFYRPLLRMLLLDRESCRFALPSEFQGPRRNGAQNYCGDEDQRQR